MKKKILLLPGDGIGPEVMAAGERVLSAMLESLALDVALVDGVIGGAAYEKTGDPLPEETIQQALNSHAVLLGAVGGPAWNDVPFEKRPEAGLLKLRQILEVYANIRPVRLPKRLSHFSPLRARSSDIDMLIVRELTGGLYFGEPKGRMVEAGETTAVDTLRYSESEIRRILDLSHKLAEKRSGRVVSVDKANVLATSRLWREVAERVHKAYPHVTLSHMLVDAMAMEMVLRPESIDVLVTENMFGDILSDVGGALVGSLGLLPSASLSDRGLHLYEPVHGSAPTLAGQGIANPIGMILSVAMLFEYSLSLPEIAEAIWQGVESTLEEGWITQDLAAFVQGHDDASARTFQVVGTQAITERILETTFRQLKRKGVVA